MKLQSLLTGILLLAGGSVARAIPHTEIYHIFQGGFNDGGTLTADFRITDTDEDGLFSASDAVLGSFLFKRPLQFSTYVAGFDIISVSGASLLFGPFSISGVEYLGGTAVMTNTGGTVIDFAFPVTGEFRTYTTTQAPVVTRLIPDGGSSLLMLAVGLLSCRVIKSRQS